MLSIRAATLAAVVVLALTPALARAQTQPSPASSGAPPAATAPDASPAATLPPITVTAGRGSDIERLDVSTTVLTREQIQAMPETSVDQIVNKIPGVWSFTVPAGQLHPTGQPFSIRGFGTSTTINTLVMLDGVPINDPYFRTIDWSVIPKASVERIEVIRGGGAASLWGNMAMGGVVNIITRRPTRTGGSVDANYGSYGTLNTDVAGEAIVTDRLMAGVEYGHQQSAGYNLTPPQYQNSNLVPTASKADNVIASTYLTPADGLKLFAKVYYHQAYEDGLTWYIAHNNWSTYRLLLGATYELDEKSSLNFSGWLGGGVFGTTNVSSGAYTLNNISANNQFVNQIEQAPNSNQGGSLFYQLTTGHLKDLKVGADFRNTQVSDNINLFSAAGVQTSFVSQGIHRLEGLFAQATYGFSAGIPVDITVGIRGDFYQALAASLQNVNKGVSTPIADSGFSSFDPRLGVKIYATDELTLRGAIYRNFTEPGMNQMYRSFASGTSFTTTNPTLQPMYSFGQEAGFDFKWREVSLSGTYFHVSLDNYIDFFSICTANAACAAPFATAAGLTGITTINQYINAGGAIFEGLEIFGAWQPIRQLTLTAGFTSTTAYLTSSSFPVTERTGVQLGQVPTYMVNAAAEWRPIPELALNVSLKSFPPYWNNTTHLQLNDGATLIDLGLSYSVAKSVDIYAAAQNLTNVQYLAQGYTVTAFEGSNSAVNNTAIPSLGMPLTISVGLRARF